MTVTASRIFEFLDQHSTCSIERYEIHSSVFSTLRKSIRAIITRLCEGNEGDPNVDADTLRTLLSEWLTVPISFNGSLLESVSALGDPRAVEMKWGRDVRTAYDLAYRASNAIQSEENPARIQIREIIRRLRKDGQRWRIYCHRRAAPHFESIFLDEPLPLDSFLHSVRDYREVEPFDVLIKVGPLRSRGWGSAPDALLSAPRFGTLAQVVWSGCADEDDFGYDPVGAGVSNGAGSVSTKPGTQAGVSAVVSWQRNVIQVGNIAADAPASADLDELAFFSQLNRGSEIRHATLVQIDAENGILYPPHSQVATFDPAPTTEEPIGYRIPGETLTDGMFVMVPILGEADLGGLHSGDGHYSRIWKERLREKRKYAPNDLIRRLQDGGIQLNYLAHRVQQWCRPASSVIHAPQTRHHFEILIKVLGIDHDETSTSRALRRPWWEYAWNEIARSRGEAIQTGMQEHEIVYEELFGILNEILPLVQSSGANREFFQLEIPTNKPLQGVVRFYKIRSTEEGFLVPDTMIKVICDLDTIEQWRV